MTDWHDLIACLNAAIAIGALRAIYDKARLTSVGLSVAPRPTRRA